MLSAVKEKLCFSKSKLQQSCFLDFASFVLKLSSEDTCEINAAWDLSLVELTGVLINFAVHFHLG